MCVCLLISTQLHVSWFSTKTVNALRSEFSSQMQAERERNWLKVQEERTCKASFNLQKQCYPPTCSHPSDTLLDGSFQRMVDQKKKNDKQEGEWMKPTSNICSALKGKRAASPTARPYWDRQEDELLEGKSEPRLQGRAHMWNITGVIGCVLVV